MVSKIRLTGVQNGGARFAKVEGFAPLAGPATAGEKRGQVESVEPENTSQTSQSSQYSQTHCADMVSKMSVQDVQNWGLKRTQRTKQTGGEVQDTCKPHENAMRTGVSRKYGKEGGCPKYAQSESKKCTA